MNYDEIKKILDKHDITTVDQLDYCLSAFESTDECLDDPVDKNCINANCYEEYFVPDCRKIIEIYNKYFQKDIKTKKLFIKYLADTINKKESSIENYMSCKSCNQQISKGIQTSLKISDTDFKKDFCNNFSIKFSYQSLFQTEYISIKQFLNKEHRVTSDTYTPLYSESERKMTKEEEHKLFDITHTSKDEFKKNLQNKDNLQGSYAYLLNLSLNAFDRNLTNESENLLLIIEDKYRDLCTSKEYLQLKAKILSVKKKDLEAIEVLRELIQKNQPNIDSESYNLLAASIKREAILEFEKYGDEEMLYNKLVESKDISYNVYKLTNDYYPALNYIYLIKIIYYMQNKDKGILVQNAINIWEHINHKTTDWWSFIANIEFLIIVEKYDEALIQLENNLSDLKQIDISEFNLFSTIRQLEFYSKFCSDREVVSLIAKLKNLST